MITICQLKVNLSLKFNLLNTELNPICHLLALLVEHPIFHISRIRVNLLFCNDVVLFWITTKNAKCSCVINVTLITIM